jgi:hypothetical protein
LADSGSIADIRPRLGLFFNVSAGFGAKKRAPAKMLVGVIDRTVVELIREQATWKRAEWGEFWKFSTT